MLNEDPKDCNICSLIRMVRIDEKDKFSGDEEWDRQLVSEEYYTKGFADGSKSVAKTETKIEGIPLATIHKYILDGIAQRNMKETEALYKLYVSLGGK
jgi:hypothetical protein